MKVKQVDKRELGRCCRKNKLLCTFTDSDNVQWVSDGAAAFAYGADHIDRETLIKQLGISEYKLVFENRPYNEKVLHEGEAYEKLAWKENFEVSSNKGRIIIIANNDNAVMIYQKYLRIVRDSDYVLYLRPYKKNYVVAVKDVSGRLIAIIMPVIYASSKLKRMSEVIENLKKDDIFELVKEGGVHNGKI